MQAIEFGLLLVGNQPAFRGFGSEFLQFVLQFLSRRLAGRRRGGCRCQLRRQDFQQVDGFIQLGPQGDLFRVFLIQQRRPLLQQFRLLVQQRLQTPNLSSLQEQLLKLGTAHAWDRPRDRFFTRFSPWVRSNLRRILGPGALTIIMKRKKGARAD